MPSFFSWQLETVFFFLAEKEKNGFKKAFLWVRRKPEEAGGQGRPPLRVRRRICGCTDALQLLPDPHPSASQTPSPEGKAFRCGGDRADRVVRPYKKSVVVRIAGDSERREQSETLFRTVGSDETDG